MKVLNNNCVEVLPSLLDKSKTQSIRAAWREIKCLDDVEFQEASFTPRGIEITFIEKSSHKEMINKLSKFKVGEEVALVWNGDMKVYHKLTKCEILHELGYPIRLGVVRITEVFKIEMFRFVEEPETICVTFSGDDRPDMNNQAMNQLIERDGFKNHEEFINYFQKNYIPEGDCDTKIFHVYRWEWING